MPFGICHYQIFVMIEYGTLQMSVARAEGTGHLMGQRCFGHYET